MISLYIALVLIIPLTMRSLNRYVQTPVMIQSKMQHTRGLPSAITMYPMITSPFATMLFIASFECADIGAAYKLLIIQMVPFRLILV